MKPEVAPRIGSVPILHVHRGGSYYNKNNIATARVQKQVGTGANKSIEQKYEKIAKEVSGGE